MNIPLIPSWVPYAAVGVAFIGVAGYAADQHMEVLSLKRAAIADQLAAERAVNEFKAKDEKKTDELAAARDAAAKAEREKASAQQNAIAAAPRTDVCINTPAYRAWLGSVPGPGDKAGDRHP
jgi:maltose-binding protein MalE